MAKQHPQGEWVRRGRRSLAAAGVLAASLTAIGTGSAAALAPDQPAGCPVVVAGPDGDQYYPAEQHPAAGAPRSAAPVPYGIPFTGKMTDGVLKVGLGDTTVLGPANANLCGLFALPDQVGQSTTSQLLITDNPVPVSLASTMGIQLFSAYVQLTASISSRISPVPAANGGLNLTLQATFAGTLVPQVGLSGLLTSLGVTSIPGLGAISGGVALPVDGFECTTLVGPITFTTTTSGSLTGQPVTGKLDDAQTSLVANDFPYPAIDPSTPPVATTPEPPGGSCSQAAATVLNSAVGLPEPVGNAQFTANASFAIHATA